MQKIIVALLACSAISLAACGGNTATAPNTNARSSNTRAESRPGGGGSGSTSAPPGVVSSHGTQPAPATSATDPEKDRNLLNTSAHDAKIESVLAKAKSPSASPAYKKAAAEAYLARANAYRDAGSPSLYKFALADYNSVLIYDPSNAEARAKRDEIVEIYRGMGRPVPQLSNEK